MCGWRLSSHGSCGIIAGLAAVVVLTGCGSGVRQDATEPTGTFRVVVPRATFPGSQRLAQRTHLVITVRNAGRKAIPNIAVTICNVTCAYRARAAAGVATSAEAFAEDLDMPYLANPSRPVWIVDRAPGPCAYSCQSGAPGGAVTAYSNTWALGSLKPGATARFEWAVTAVKAGRHVVAWQVAAGLNGDAKALLANGSSPAGRFKVTILTAPQRSYVKANGQVVAIGR